MSATSQGRSKALTHTSGVRGGVKIARRTPNDPTTARATPEGTASTYGLCQVGNPPNQVGSPLNGHNPQDRRGTGHRASPAGRAPSGAPVSRCEEPASAGK